MKRLRLYENKKLEMIFLILSFFCVLALGIVMLSNSVSLYLKFDVDYNDVYYEELTFDRYEIKVVRYATGRSISTEHTYEIYFKEHENPFVVDRISQRKFDKDFLAQIEEGSIMKVYYLETSSKKYDYEICETSCGSKVLLNLSDYVRINKNNQMLGFVLWTGFMCFGVFLVVKIALISRGLRKTLELGNLKFQSEIHGNNVCVYLSIEASSLVVNGEIFDQYRAVYSNDCTLKGKLCVNGKKILIKAKIKGSYLYLHCDNQLLATKFLAFD